MVKCSEVLQCSNGTSNKLPNIIIRKHIDNRNLLLICTYMYVSHSLVFFRLIFLSIYGCIPV